MGGHAVGGGVTITTRTGSRANGGGAGAACGGGGAAASRAAASRSCSARSRSSSAACSFTSASRRERLARSSLSAACAEPSALAARSGRPPHLLAQALHLARHVAQARSGRQLARPALAEGNLEPILLGARRPSGRHQALDLRVRAPGLVLERQRDRPRRGVRLAQPLDLGGRRRRLLLRHPRSLARLVHGLLAVQALACARRLELLAQALLA